jgi:hypothetical protein
MSKLPEAMSIPKAGKHYYDLSRNASYEAERLGLLPTIRVGKKMKKVLTRVMERRIEKEAAKASRNRSRSAQTDIAKTGELHRNVMKAMPTAPRPSRKSPAQ